MRRLLIHVEGEAEEIFVNEVLRPHLLSLGYQSVAAKLLGNARARSRRGGIQSWHIVKRDIERHLAGDKGCLATTMVDYYALPDSWPGRSHARTLPHPAKAPHMNDALNGDFSAHCPYGQRFEPFVLMHEFEALLFSDCARFAEGIGRPELSPAFQSVRDQFATPEEINDSPATAPSKRVLQILPGYRKPLLGALAALEIGLDKIRQECPNFDAWLTRLEQRVATCT